MIIFDIYIEHYQTFSNQILHSTQIMEVYVDLAPGTLWQGPFSSCGPHAIEDKIEVVQLGHNKARGWRGFSAHVS